VHFELPGNHTDIPILLKCKANVGRKNDANVSQPRLLQLENQLHLHIPALGKLHLPSCLLQWLPLRASYILEWWIQDRSQHLAAWSGAEALAAKKQHYPPLFSHCECSRHFCDVHGCISPCRDQSCSLLWTTAATDRAPSKPMILIAM
jgi:hypothetical protein